MHAMRTAVAFPQHGRFPHDLKCPNGKHALGVPISHQRYLFSVTCRAIKGEKVHWQCWQKSGFVLFFSA